MSTFDCSEIYLDANATTPVLPIAAQAAFTTMELSFGNPSSAHMTGIRAKYIMESARTEARKILGAHTGKLIFTSGATEGIQTAILSSLVDAKKQGRIGPKATLLYGATEHKAVPETLKHWNALLDINADVVAIPVDKQGRLDLEFIAEHIENALIICTMAVNNETGVYQDLVELEKVIRTANSDVKWMVDCVQALGKLSMSMSQTTIDYAPFSGHKLYAPKGIGMLYVRDGAPFTACIAGGGQEQGLRSGTENLPGIAAMQAVLESLNNTDDHLFKSADVLHGYRQQLANSIKRAFPNVVFNHDFSVSVPTTLNFSVKNLSAKEIMDVFDAAQIRVSSGSACSSKVTGSFVLDAMGLPRWQSEGAIRMSFGPAATQDEIDRACEAIERAALALQSSCILGSSADEQGKLDGIVQLQYNGNCCWIIADKQTKQCVVIDPIEPLAARIEQMVRCRNYSVNAIIDTHGHADHTSCATMLRAVLADLMVSDQVDLLGWPTAEVHAVKLPTDESVDALSVGDHMLVRINTPGHTLDSISLLLANRADVLDPHRVEYAFCGDMIMIGGLGRTDFENSSSAAMYDSIRLLSRCITDNTLICPAHDYDLQFTTTLPAEKRCNNLLHEVLEGRLSQSDFVTQKQQIDLNLEKPNASMIMCGATKLSDISLLDIDIAPSDASQYLQHHQDALVLDVREAHEHELQQLNNVVNMVNVPLTRLTGFLASLMQTPDRQKELICICRSGSRSQVVAKTLRRLGFSQAKHIQGGYALYR